MYTKIVASSTHRCWADMMENFIGKKEKWTNKGTDKPYVANLFNAKYNLSYLMFIPNFKILGQAVPEKSETKK